MSALALKLIACVCMLLDHIGYCVPSLFALRAAGRLAFPIYVFLMTEGFRHSSNRPRYALRLLSFALLSQVPFGLFCAKDPLYGTLNVMFTLLIAFCCLWLVERAGEQKNTRVLAGLGVLALCVLFWLGLIRSDYGAKGILLSFLMFRLGRKKDWKSTILLLLGMTVIIFHENLLLNGYNLIRSLLGLPYGYTAPSGWLWMQLFSLLCVPILLLLYNGEKGPAPRSLPARKAVQYAFYAFYPVHMLILYWTIR